MRSVPVEKSGVMVTQDIETGQSGWLSIAVNEGVGGAVDGQAAESLRVHMESGKVILLAQALNGFLLPLVAVFLLLAVNDRELLGARVNGALSNTLMVATVAVTVLLGLRGVARALATALDTTFPETWVLAACAAVIVLAAVPLARTVQRRR